MFSTLRQGCQLYVLHTSTATPYVEVGTVEMVNNNLPMAYYPNMLGLPIDVSVRIGDKSTSFQKLPANAESATVTDAISKEAVVVACTKEAISNEVEMMKQKSIEAVNSVEFHRNRIGECEKLLTRLNPEMAEKAAQAQEISDLKSQLKEMRELMAQLKGEASS